VVRTWIPKNMGMNPAICHSVGISLSMIAAKSKVNAGPIEIMEVALLIDIRWIASSQKIFDNPSRRIPFISRNGNDLLIAVVDAFGSNARETPSSIVPLSMLLTNIRVVVLTLLTALFW